ncbi:MAG: c-type cytochrome [Acetobacteraceae bacterium]|nr:c-type cytochrome [Acetobacteraceae bacterium]
MLWASKRIIAVRAAVSALALATSAAVACADQAEDIARGKDIWANKAGCPACHGWAGIGVGGGFHSEGRAASLRETQLTRDEIRMTIQCGRPGTPMPHFDRFAYTDKRCYDMTAQDLGEQVPRRASTTLQSYEIDALADYVATQIKGAGPVTRAQCLDYFGAAAGSHCEEYPAQ